MVAGILPCGTTVVCCSAEAAAEERRGRRAFCSDIRFLYSGSAAAVNAAYKEVNMTKKILCFLLIMTLTLVMTGCSMLQEKLEGTISELGESVLNQANPEAPEDDSADPSAAKSTVLSDNVESASADDAERYTEEEMIPAVKALADGGFEVCTVFFNGVLCGEEALPDAEGNPTRWYPVADERFASIEDLKAFAETYYTYDYAQAVLYSSAFAGDYPKYMEQDGVLYINNDVGGLGWGIQWQFDTAVIAAQTENSVTLSIDTLLFDEPDGTKLLVLTKVNEEWRLDSSILG